MKGKVETVSLDRVKPAHLECEPTTGTTIQRITPNKPQSSKATRISKRNAQGPPRPGSADTPTSNGTSVKTKNSTAVRSSKILATVPKQLDVKVNLSNRDNTYIARIREPPPYPALTGTAVVYESLWTTASFRYFGAGRTGPEPMRSWYFSRTSDVTLGDYGRAVGRSL